MKTRIELKREKDIKEINEAINFDVIENLKMDESDIITQYLAGNIKGVFVDINCFYMPIRITGTGITTRRYTMEEGYTGEFKIERLKREFMTDRFVEQCGRIPVLLDHPDYDGCSLLSFNSPDSLAHIIGNTIKAYKKDDEVWAIAKIYFLPLLEMIGTEIFSTSPAVTSNMPSREWDDLCEESPIEINHIAFVEKGYWDRVSDLAFDVSQITIKSEALEFLSEKSLKIFQNLQYNHTQWFKSI